MQQRYYDPICGCFLSVDPVTAYGGNWRQFNRYAYAFNNPYKFTDPDGRVVQYAFTNGATVGDGAAVLNYWMKSPTVMGELNQILKSNATYTIEFNRGGGQFGYDSSGKIVNIDVTSGLKIKSSGQVQSPALGGGHEVSHAAQNDRVGDSAFNKSLEPPQTVTTSKDGTVHVVVGTSPEEARATKVESQAAKELGEPTRNNYHDTSGAVKTCTPTTGKQC